ncbi:AAA family ATPase [Bythopirellula polymerisocia]|uniref:Septum site-determining protein MinD n=1 Tax=Bythopirellula polymerisocia TaxID=2528003 RepID=A0A5C6CL76_9BACT|nr:AAA family ATPase [Bythopirellula polymerisocia]TWU25633.1 Septum site-determining protein MinD [Bythopirellula polymerisocia]
MANVLRIALVDPNDASREKLKSVLLQLDSVWLEAESSRYEFFSDVIEQTKADIGLIAMDADPARAIQLVAEVTAEHPQCTLLVTSSSTDGRLILESMRAGAKEFLTEPLKQEDLITALKRVKRQNAGEKTTNAAGCRVIAVGGATGGVGSTSVAVNLACAIASDEANSVVLVDLDVALGDADVFLDTIPEYTLADVAQNVGRLDLTLLKKSLTKHSTGLHLLPRPVQLEDVKQITPDSLQRVIGLLKTSFTHIVIDLSKYFGDLDMQAIYMADDILMVTQLDLPCLRNVVRLMMTFDSDESLRSKVKIIVNRVGHDSSQISLKKAQESIGRDIFWQIPNDYRTMVEVRNNGVPLVQHAPKAGITNSILQLSDAICGKVREESEVGDKDSKSRRWLNLWPAK